MTSTWDLCLVGADVRMLTDLMSFDMVYGTMALFGRGTYHLLWKSTFIFWTRIDGAKRKTLMGCPQRNRCGKGHRRSMFPHFQQQIIPPHILTGCCVCETCFARQNRSPSQIPRSTLVIPVVVRKYPSLCFTLRWGRISIQSESKTSRTARSSSHTVPCSAITDISRGF